MKLKRISALVLALAMTASVAAFAAEGEPDVVVDEGVVREVNHDQGDISLLSAPAGGGFGGGLLSIPVAITKPTTYPTVITINGKALEAVVYETSTEGSWETETNTVLLTNLPAAAQGYVPLRAIAQADHGSAYWYKEGKESWFYLAGGVRVTTSFVDMSISVNDEPMEGVSALLIEGVTYVPVSIFNSIEGYEVVNNSADGVESYEIKTPNGAPLMKMAYQAMETAGTGSLDQFDIEEFITYFGEEHGFSTEQVSEGVVFMSAMSLNADVMILVKLADESKAEEVRAAFEAYQAAKMAQFDWGYLVNQLPKVENAQIVFEGDWALFLIAENAEAAAEEFKATVAEMA